MSKHWGSETDSTLRLARVIELTEVLGPGKRAALIVQGCHLRCRGCIAEQTHSLDGGFEVGLPELAAQLIALRDIAGITFSGGEPFLQAAALTRLVDLVRRERPRLSTMSFSGYRLEWLKANGSPAQEALLDRLDLLVDGPYVERLHAPLLWRGSRNQRLLALSGRHRAELTPERDVPAGMEWSIDAELAFEWVGVPPIPGLLARVMGEREESCEKVPDSTQEVVGG